MKTHVNKSTFVNAFDRCGRGNQFTVQARIALFEYFEDLESDLGEEFELDPIAICCDWTEYSDAFEACSDYTGDTELAYFEDEEVIQAHAIDYLLKRTEIILFEGGILVMAF
jgi:hypothetical protein